LSEFDFDLPDALIAQDPVNPRDHSKLLIYHKNTKKIEHAQFFELSNFLTAKDLLILNNTKVIPARLKVRDEKETAFEVFLLKQIQEKSWECLVKPSKKIKNEKTKIFFKDNSTAFLEKLENGFIVHFEKTNNFFHWLTLVGEMPLPPYIKRELTKEDTDRYQTLYAKNPGSIAAPTAGLHFTEGVFESLKEKGIQKEEITLNVGYGTFAPIRNEDLTQHQMHFENYEISKNVSDLIDKHEKKVIAVGTTTLRALESIEKYGLSGNTDIFIQPGYTFKKIDGLITNFHLPKSTLFILFCAFVGIDEAKRIYQEAIAHSYRFFSYGDGMLVI
jgi:S-adenosylmethionine:tRNA ribosyltransferase-isomerase